MTKKIGFLLTIALLNTGLPIALAQTINDIRGWVPTQRITAPASLRLRMLPCTTCPLGSTMQIKVTTQENGFLFLFDINSAGQLTRIFPNKYDKPKQRGLSRIHGYVKAGQTVTIPDDNYGFDFTAREPIGKGLVVALLVEKKLVGLPDEFKTLEAAEARATLRRLNKYLLKKYGRPLRWSIVTLDYKITRPR